MYETERLVLREFRESDLDDLLRMWNQPEVQKGAMNTYNVPLSNKFKEQLRTWGETTLFYVIITLKSTGEFIGNHTIASQNPKNQQGELGITLLKEHWGKGYAEEVTRFTLDHAFREMNLHRVRLSVFEGNDRAVRLYRKIGFVEEGRSREAIWSGGGWKDVINMGILEHEWAALYWPKKTQ